MVGGQNYGPLGPGHCTALCTTYRVPEKGIISVDYLPCGSFILVNMGSEFTLALDPKPQGVEVAAREQDPAPLSNLWLSCVVAVASQYFRGPGLGLTVTVQKTTHV